MSRKFIVFGTLIRGILCGFEISLPDKTKVLSGSCAFIPCKFEIDEKYNSHLTDRAKRLWYKDEKKVFDSTSPNSGLLKGVMFGTPTAKNCTTRFDNITQNDKGSYMFRLESSNDLKYTYRSPVLQIVVIDSPPKPAVVLYKEHQEVLEGRSVSLHCSAEILCSSRPPALRWISSTKHLLNESIREQQHQEQSQLISQLNFTATPQQHNDTFTCIISYQLQSHSTAAQESLTLHIQYAPRNTSVFVVPSGSVLENQSVTLSCRSDANPAVNYTWSRHTDGALEYLSTGPQLILNSIKPTHSGSYYCTAQNAHGTQNTSVLLDVQYAPRNTSVFVVPSGSVLENQSVTLSCRSDANPAVNYTWSRHTDGALEYLSTGPQLILNSIKPTHSGSYYCTAQNKHGTQNTSVLLDVQYAPEISSSSNCSRSVLMVTCFCEVHGNPRPALEWHLSGHPVSNSSSTSITLETYEKTGFKSTLTVHQSLTDTLTLQCVAVNSHGTARQQFQLPQTSKDPPSTFFLLVGTSVGFLVIVMVGVVSFFCVRRQNCKPSQPGPDSTELVQKEDAAVLDNEEQFVYANKAMMSPADAIGLNPSESLHYSAIDFTNTEAPTDEIRGICSLTSEYTEIRHHTSAESEVLSTAVTSDTTTTDLSEDTTYENIRRH